MKRILITGTTSGLGKATAFELAKAGHQIIMAVRNMDAGRLLKDEIVQKTKNRDIDVMYLDLSSFTSIKAFTNSFHTKYAYLDVLINNAGVFCEKKAFTEEGFEKTIGVNYLGQVLLTNALIPSLKTVGSARIINITSKAGFYGKINLSQDAFKKHPAGFKAYSASKGMQLQYTLHLSKSLKPFDITVNAVHPGSVDTGIWSGKSVMMKLMRPIVKMKYEKPEAACRTAVQLAQDNSGFESGCLYEKDVQKMIIPDHVKNTEAINMLMAYTNELLESYF